MRVFPYYRLISRIRKFRYLTTGTFFSFFNKVCQVCVTFITHHHKKCAMHYSKTKLYNIEFCANLGPVRCDVGTFLMHAERETFGAPFVKILYLTDLAQKVLSLAEIAISARRDSAEACQRKACVFLFTIQCSSPSEHFAFRALFDTLQRYLRVQR